MRKLALALMVTAWAGCNPPAEQAPPQASTAMTSGEEHVAVPLTPTMEAGKAIFENICWTCHGTAGRGDGPAVLAGAVSPPPTFHTQDYARASTATLERRFQAGLQGADPTHPHMQFVSSILRPERFAEALAYIPALTWPAEIPGSSVAGKALYDFRCAGCHGSTGRGDGTASEFLRDVRPADFTQDTLLAARNWDAVYNRIREGGQQVHGSSMPPWGIVLREADMWDLVAYLATFQPGLVAAPRWMQ